MDNRIRYIALAFATVGILAGGCNNVDPTKGYSSQELYDNNIQTVYVNMFDSKSFRRGLEFDLTSAVVSQLEIHSPYKVISNKKKADTILSGKIINISEKTLTQDRDLDRPVENQIVVTAEVNWRDQRNGKLLINKERFRFSGNYAVLMAAGRAAAGKEAVNKMALRIVEAMEEPW